MAVLAAVFEAVGAGVLHAAAALVAGHHANGENACRTVLVEPGVTTAGELLGLVAVDPSGADLAFQLLDLCPYGADCGQYRGVYFLLRVHLWHTV